MPTWRAAPPPRSRGQALAEFALVVPIFMLLVGAIVQGGLLFWGQNTLTQIVRDTGRYAASKTTCDAAAITDIQARGAAIAASSSFNGTISSLTVTFSGVCPPRSNQEVGWVTIGATGNVPVLFPVIPGGGAISSNTQYRMEPTPK